MYWHRVCSRFSSRASKGKPSSNYKLETCMKSSIKSHGSVVWKRCWSAHGARKRWLNQWALTVTSDGWHSETSPYCHGGLWTWESKRRQSQQPMRPQYQFMDQNLNKKQLHHHRIWKNQTGKKRRTKENPAGEEKAQNGPKKNKLKLNPLNLYSFYNILV